MTFSKNTESNTYEPIRRLSLGDWRAELLPFAPYQANYHATHSSIGFAFAHQEGVHAIGTDKRAAFQAAPNSIAYVPRGCDVFSESEVGGEYLKVWQTNEPETNEQAEHSVSNVIDSTAIQAAHGLRLLLIAGQPIDELICESYLLTLQSCGIQSKNKSNRDDLISNHRSDKIWSSQLLEYIEGSLSTQLTVSELAIYSQLSARHFNKKFTRLIGVTPHNYIVDRRLVRARQLLANSNWDISAIAYECGFSSHSHMTAQLHARHGATPSQLRGVRTTKPTSPTTVPDKAQRNRHDSDHHAAPNSSSC